MKSGAQLFAYLKQLLKLYTRQRDKAMMLQIVEEVGKLLSSTICALEAHMVPARRPSTIS